MGMRDTIILSPIGTEMQIYVEWIDREIRTFFGCPTKTVALLDDIDFSYDPSRGQYHSTTILRHLAGLAPAGTLKILAITDRDLFIPILTHVYGEAQLGGTACVVSTRRLRDGMPPDGGLELLRLRLIKEAVHELGHTFNLRHCRDEGCLMHYCRKIEHVDRKSASFCRYCRVMLADEIREINRTQDGKAGPIPTQGPPPEDSHG